MNKKKLVASSLLVGMTLGSVAPLVGVNKNINIASAATQEVFYAEKKNVNVLTMYEIYAKGKLNKHYMEAVEEKKHITEEYVETTVDETDNESYISFNEEDDIELESEFNDITYDNFVEMSVPVDSTFKSYMDADCITNTSTDQYALKTQYILDYNSGVWTVDDRYLIALGSYYSHNVGQYIDLIMENGSIIPCIVGDCKANDDTNYSNIQHISDGSVVEFIVNTSTLNQVMYYKNNTNTGNVSDVIDGLQGEISYIRVYE